MQARETDLGVEVSAAGDSFVLSNLASRTLGLRTGPLEIKFSPNGRWFVGRAGEWMYVFDGKPVFFGSEVQFGTQVAKLCRDRFERMTGLALADLEVRGVEMVWG